MNEPILQHLDAIEKWICQQGEAPSERPSVLTAEERKQLLAVNKTIQQLASLGVSVPPDLRELKLRLSAKEEQAGRDAELLGRVDALESVGRRLKELARLARASRDGLKSPKGDSGNKRHFGVQLAELIEAGVLTAEDRLELQWQKDGHLFEGRVRPDGSVGVRTPSGWKNYETLSGAAADIAGRALNGWDHWARVTPDGLREKLAAIRAAFLKGGGK
jgi:phage baseplate assembly protein W